MGDMNPMFKDNIGDCDRRLVIEAQHRKPSYATSPDRLFRPPPDAASEADPSDTESGVPYFPVPGTTPYAAAIKLLVSTNVAGSIIGRSGQTISEVQKQSGSRIKLSQAGYFYPGTEDRVCLIQGDPENCKKALRLLFERLHMIQEHQYSQHLAWQLQRQKAPAPSFDFVIQVLVPSSCCGMIIGRLGSNIKMLEESTGVLSVRLSPKDGGDGRYQMMPVTSERIVTITGPTVDTCFNCVCHIFDDMLSKPEISRYNNLTTNYSRVPTPDAGFLPGNRPAQVPLPPGLNRLHPQNEPAVWGSLPQSGNPFSPQPVNGFPRRITSDVLGMQQPMNHPRLFGAQTDSPDRLVGRYPDGVTQPPPSPYMGIPAGGIQQPQQQPPMYMFQPPIRDMGSPSPEDLNQSTSSPDLLALQFEQSMQLDSISTNLSPTAPPPSQQHIAPSPPPPPSQQHLPLNFSSMLNNDGFAPQPPAPVGPGCFNAHIMVPDSMIGSILGRGGTTLTELENISGTRIRASQRGDFIPGTRSRLVAIRGPNVQSVWQAQFLISQRIVLPPTAMFAGMPPLPVMHAPPPMPMQQQQSLMTPTEGNAVDSKTAPAATTAQQPLAVSATADPQQPKTATSS